ncbi:MAG: fatty acid desaturase [Proteobacteria bacterium]|nr:fatty acid desaturase [Pseudomonadota bacterium]
MNASSVVIDRPLPDWSVIIFLGGVHLFALSALLPGTFSWPAVAVALVLHWLTAGVGVTLGYHRLITHRSFRAPKWLEYVLLFCGTLACQSPLEWVAKHRMHHHFSDTAEDPHDINRGFWWAHVGWILHKLPCDRSMGLYVKDIARDPVYRFFDRTMLLWQLALGIVLFLIGGLPFVVWGMFVRLVAVYHSTWFVNSATHSFGYRSYDVGDQSTNCWWVALISYGEGWHNNHHEFPRSARHGLRWWEVDMTWWMIRGLRVLGLAKNVVLPPYRSG